jgi:hypothetical protein
MKQVPIMTYLSEDDAREVFKIADRLGISTAAVVRACVRYVLHEASYVWSWQKIARATGEIKGGEKDERSEE